MTDKVDWRGKYRALALEVEQHEQQRSQAADCLRSLAVQLDLAAHGESAELDQLLASLVTELQTGKLDKVPELLRKTEKHVRLLDETRAQQARQLIKRIDEWVLLLQGTAESEEGGLVEVRQKLAGVADNMRQLPGLIDTLLTFQRQISRSDVGAVSTDDLAQPNDVISKRMAQRLLELIQLFNVPVQHRARTHELISRLEAGPGPEELERCLEEVSALARTCGGSTGEDIQAYLVGLNEQLAYLRSFLDRAETADVVQLKRNNLLDQTVRHDVHKISQAVKQTSDINELKTAVSTQLASLIKAVDTHKKAENQHVAELQRERKILLSRLEEMESKAAGFRRSAEEAHMKSRTDPLTGLANRFAYDQQLANEVARYQRYGTPFALCVADIDFFKRINDQYGHLAGDKVLRLMAKVLRSSLRGVDFIARFGGEEFVILMPSTGGESARQAAEKVRKAVEQSPFNFQSRPVHITISIGVAEVVSDDTAESLFGRADSNLYAAKSNGRNKVVMH
jgi:diguanylate cyclase